MARWYHCGKCGYKLRWCGGSLLPIQNGDIRCRRCGEKFTSGKRKPLLNRIWKGMFG